MHRFGNLPLLIVIAAFGLTGARAEQPKQLFRQVQSARDLALNSPVPEFPDYARKHGWTGVGLYYMNVNAETGAVTSVEIKQSSGHQMLDKAATDALRKWRFKPGTVKKVRIPITWAAQGVEIGLRKK